MRIVVTGSEGTLGQPLMRELISRGHEVVGIDLAHDGRRDYELIRADIGRHREIARALDRVNPDLVFNLAAEFGRNNGEDYYERNWTTNCVGLRNILECQEALDFRLVQASSSEVYGEVRPSGDGLREEDTDTDSPQHLNDYAISKWAGELQIRQHVKRTGCDTMVMRFFNCYGPGEHFHRYRSVVCLFIHGALTGEGYEVYRGGLRDFMFIDDFTPTLANAASMFVPGETVNIGGGDYRGIEELDEIIRAETGLTRDAVIYHDAEPHNIVAKRPDISKAVAMLGHAPSTSLEDGIARTVAWMREEMS